MRPAKVHSFEGLDERPACCVDCFSPAVCDKNVAKQGDVAFAAAVLAARFLIQARAGSKLSEIGGRPHEPRVSKTRGATYSWLRPGSKPDGRPWPLHRTRRDRG